MELNTDYRFKDRTGTRFDHLLVIEYMGNMRGGEAKYWKCLCDCGSVCIKNAGYFNYDGIKCCRDCSVRIRSRKAIIHAATCDDDSSREYHSWSGAKHRVSCPTCKHYPYYGGRGVRMCSWWFNSFPHFLEDMGKCPDGCSIHRIDNNGHYSCGHCDECLKNGWTKNCEWSDRFKQAQVRRNAVMLTWNGQTKNMAVWERELGFNKGVFWQRKLAGWSDAKIITTPPMKNQFVFKSPVVQSHCVTAPTAYK